MSVFSAWSGDHFAAQFVDLLAQLVALAFGVERVPDPADQVAHRLQGLVGAVLDRRDDRQERPLHAVQLPAGCLAEVGRSTAAGRARRGPMRTARLRRTVLSCTDSCLPSVHGTE